MNDPTAFASKDFVKVELKSAMKVGSFLNYFPHGSKSGNFAVPLRDDVVQKEGFEVLGVGFAFYRLGNVNLVPVKYDAESGGILYYPVAEKDDRMCLDLIFDLREVAADDLNEWGHRKNPFLSYLMQLCEDNNMHLTGIAVHDIPYSRADENNLRYVVFRLYSKLDFDCAEHPENMMFAPLGQYHCPECGHMVVAGCFHPPKTAYL